jgi:UDP-2,3-diacylglucosamine pyrophosphatase LpxH
MIVVVSDIHLGYDKSDKNLFNNFVDSKLGQLNKNDHLVILGDLLDFWRRKNVFAALENDTILDKLCKLTRRTDVYYIVGNHDYSIEKLYKQFGNFYPFKVSKNLRLSDDSKKSFYFIHGYELEVLTQFEFLTIAEYEEICENLCERTDNFFGGIMSRLYSDLKMAIKIGEEGISAIHSITKPPEKRKGFETVEDLARSNASRRIFLGMEEDDFLIFGHTHRPFLDGNKKVANSGSWVVDAVTYDTYIIIDGGKVKLNQWRDNEVKELSTFG